MAKQSGSDLKKVKELIQLMIDNNLVEVEIEEGDNKISLKRPNPAAQVVTQVPMAQAPMQMPASAPAPAAADAAPASDEGLIEIPSPMVGTFYTAPSPDSDPFVSVGDTVKADTVVCIVEAMKVMNEIKAEVTGTIAEVMCKAGEAVEFGQVLFKVKP